MRLYDEGRSPIKGKKISEIIAELTFLKGLGKAETRSKLVEQWKAVIENFFPPQIVQFTNPGGIRNGRLTVFVSGSNAISARAEPVPRPSFLRNSRRFMLKLLFSIVLPVV